jgi:hypothetical protein
MKNFRNSHTLAQKANDKLRKLFAILFRYAHVFSHSYVFISELEKETYPNRKMGKGHKKRNESDQETHTEAFTLTSNKMIIKQ